MVESLGACTCIILFGLFLSILMSFLCVFYTDGMTRGCASGVSTFSPILIFGKKTIFGVTIKLPLLIG